MHRYLRSIFIFGDDFCTPKLTVTNNCEVSSSSKCHDAVWASAFWRDTPSRCLKIKMWDNHLHRYKDNTLPLQLVFSWTTWSASHPEVPVGLVQRAVAVRCNGLRRRTNCAGAGRASMRATEVLIARPQRTAYLCQLFLFMFNYLCIAIAH